MVVNLDRIPRNEPVVVHIPSVEHGEAFLRAMKEKYPEAVKSWRKAYYEKWRDDEGGNYYFPRLHSDTPHMTHGNRAVYEERVIRFMDFYEVCDVIELETQIGDIAIESLFDAG